MFRSFLFAPATLIFAGAAFASPIHLTCLVESSKGREVVYEITINPDRENGLVGQIFPDGSFSTRKHSQFITSKSYMLKFIESKGKKDFPYTEETTYSIDRTSGILYRSWSQTWKHRDASGSDYGFCKKSDPVDTLF